MPSIAASSSDGPFTIDVVSDVVCPWCYIGKRRLERALELLAMEGAGVVPHVRWHPFQLNPDLPPEGVDRRDYLAAKFGGPERAQAIYDRVRAAARSSGLDLALEAIARQPSTLDAHRLVAWAQADAGVDASALVERLFRAYFVEGRFVGDRDELARIAAEAGADAGAARAMLASDAWRADVADADERVRRMGVQGVPFFVFGGAVAVSGAHEPQTLLGAIREARARDTAVAGAAH
jgi:predicted DsbA family dithiol-disulfide isomerase